MSYKNDIEIAREAKVLPITQVAEKLGIEADDLEAYGKYKAKIAPSYWEKIKDNPDGKLVLVTAINPTPAGEGKTTITVGLGQALGRLGIKSVIALREPSLGPCMGVKGGAAGGGYSQVVPMEDINLHFTGDFHAITTARVPDGVKTLCFAEWSVMDHLNLPYALSPITSGTGFPFRSYVQSFTNSVMGLTP